MPLSSHPTFTADGIIKRKEIGRMREQGGHPSMDVTMSIPLRDDAEEAQLRGMLDHAPDETGRIRTLIRSGYAQLGLNIFPASPLKIGGHEAEARFTIQSVRGTTGDRILSTLRDLVKNKESIRPGGLALIPHGSACTREQVQRMIEKSQLLLPDGSAIEEDGRLLLPIRGAYDFADELLDTEAIGRILRDGKHGLQRLRARAPLPSVIQPGAFFLGYMRGLSIGGATGILERQTTIAGADHLPAFRIHGIRSTGKDIDRQVEIVYAGDGPVATGDVRAQMYLYPPDADLRALAERVIVPRTIRDGVDLTDLITERSFLHVARSVSDRKDPTESRPFGLLLRSGRAAEIPWASRAGFQDGLTELRTRHFLEARMSDKDSDWVDGQGIPPAARPVTDMIGWVGGEQQHGKMLVTAGFPPPTVMDGLVDADIGVFVAEGLRIRPDAFPEDREERCATIEGDIGIDMHDSLPETERMRRKHALFFDSVLYGQFKSLEGRGAKLYLMLPDMADEITGDPVPAHMREFHRGLWVKPHEKERLGKVHTVIAMYGSHVKGLDDTFQSQLDTFMRGLKKQFGDGIAVTHGKGPGFMKMADVSAERQGIVRIGVGICVEGQAGNCKPEAMVDFHHMDRLTRQKLMDDIATFKVFNLGGAGTLEEAAITLCSQKLGKKLITPIIFVDPLGLGQNGGNLWELLRQQIVLLAEKKVLTSEQIGTMEIQLQLLQSSAPNYLHCVSSYDEALRIIQNFSNDPVGYYDQQKIPLEEALAAQAREAETLEQTGFPRPTFETCLQAAD